MPGAPRGGDGGGEQATEGAVSSIDDLETAVIRIESQGTFVDPELGEAQSVAGSGSGFIISPDGVAVTNNHVVTGAATIEVYVGGGDDDPVDARILASSECSDLAVIDLDGDGYPFLEWREEPIEVGDEVYSAGFPLGDPEFTLTRGILSKARAQGDFDWASVDDVVEHDARINPGNSGGPLVDEAARVVGVNFAGSDETDQNFAIAPPTATEVVEQLREGEPVDWVGVNGVAVASDDGSLTGVWVSSVESGSPASEVGLEPGDIITSLDNLQLATDGTMADYCQVLRTNSPGDVIAIEVLRQGTQEVLEGELNGAELEQSFSFAEEFAGEVGGEGGGSDTATYGSYVDVSDDSGRINVSVPEAWTYVNGAPTDNGNAQLTAAASEAFDQTFNESGAQIVVDDSATDPDALLDQLAEGIPCTSEGREPYADPLYSGVLESFTGCEGTGAAAFTVAAQPEDGSITIFVLVQVLNDADLEALDTILNSFTAS